VFHIDVIIYGEEVFIVFFHVIDVYEVTLGTRNPLNAFETTLFYIFFIGVPRETVEETHFKIVALFIDNVLNFAVYACILNDNVIFKNNGIFDVLVETPPVEFHVPHITPDRA
jgi:hypothetical protein